MTASHGQAGARVLVIGAAGNTGQHIVSRLTELGIPVRAATRQGKPTGQPLAEAVRFDWAQADSHDAALAGVDRMYLIAPAVDADPGPIWSVAA